MERNAALFLDLRRAVEEYPLSRRKIQQLIHDRRLSAFRLDGKIIFRRADLENLITAQPVGADLDKIVNNVMRDLGAE